MFIYKFSEICISLHAPMQNFAEDALLASLHTLTDALVQSQHLPRADSPALQSVLERSPPFGQTRTITSLPSREASELAEVAPPGALPGCTPATPLHSCSQHKSLPCAPLSSSAFCHHRDHSADSEMTQMSSQNALESRQQLSVADVE